MQLELEAKFLNIQPALFRQKLESVGAKLIKPRFKQTRTVFYLPKGHEINGGWLRVRDEGDKITMTLKVVDGNKIENQKEINLTVDSFGKANELLKPIGCLQKGFQETYRELWELDGNDITIDEWPFFEPFVEIEGKSEESVREAADKLEFEWSDAVFGSISDLYGKKYGVSHDFIDTNIPILNFEIENPFTSHSK